MRRIKQSVYVFCFLFYWLFPACSDEKDVKPIHYNGSYNRDFNDKNDVQLAVAGKIGIQPLTEWNGAEKRKEKLKKIQSQDNYEVDELTHSIPYLVPRAAALLDKIADNFADTLENRNAPHYRLVVTSILRTRADIKQLQRRNGNSTSNSTHLYGTTFDISWKRFQKADKSKTKLSNEQLKMALALVLRDLKREKACYVKHERKQACFHITVREE
ncbi:MAG: DUF5715 family protein [Dysgonamonadaceae bacterium]|nr:DUF5715 family protein [Dysgonamonadaceae bacterium]